METATVPQIKASELRIGNWVKRGETLHQVLPMDFIYLYGDEDTEFGAIYSPIPLSPEILEKCGFERKSETLLVHSVYRNFHLKEYIGESIFDVYKADCGKISEVKDLHELQNLYHCLTGEELPVSKLTNEL